MLLKSSVGFMSIHIEREDGIFPNSCIFPNSFVDHEKVFRWSALKLKCAFRSPKGLFRMWTLIR